MLWLPVGFNRKGGSPPGATLLNSWLFESGSELTDTTGGQNLSAIGTPAYTTGFGGSGQALDLSSATCQLYREDNYTSLANADEYTITFDVYITSLATGVSIFNIKEYPGSTTFINLTVYGGGNPALDGLVATTQKDASENVVVAESAADACNDGAWRSIKIEVSASGGYMKTYVDDVQVSSGTIADGLGAVDAISIGTYTVNDNFYLDNFKVYDGIL